jgi:putative transcriptional regulator
MLLYRGEDFPENAHYVFDGVCLGGDMGMVERILTGSGTKESFRAYLGYSGWGPGQLESEMKTGSWILLPADPKLVFEKDPASVWRDLLLTLDEAYRPYADMPFDPSCN